MPGRSIVQPYYKKIQRYYLSQHLYATIFYHLFNPAGGKSVNGQALVSVRYRYEFVDPIDFQTISFSDASTKAERTTVGTGQIFQ